MNDLNENKCPLEDVAAYIDGELSEAGVILFEDHLKSCVDCTDELRVQRQLLCTLDIAFHGSRSFQLPKNFTRVVTARAENDLSGMRNQRERRRALKLCAMLALISFALLGATTRTVVWDPVRSFFKVAASLLQLVWQASSEALMSTSVLVRVIGRAVLLTQNGLAFGIIAAFLFSVSVLPFLLAKYHRAQTIE